VEPRRADLGAQVFWPEGPQAHDVVALVIDPGHADV
jgi:hypothetical protein